MKRTNYSRLAALVLTGTMVFGSATTVFAEDNKGDITITNIASDATNAAASAYQVLQYNSTKGEWELTDWAKTALGNDAGSALTTLTDEKNSNKNEIAKILTKLASATNKPEAITGTLSTDGKSIAIDTDDLGSYLVIVTSENYTYTNMLVSNYTAGNQDPNANTEAAVKGTKNTIIESKTADQTYYAVGDTVKYTVSGHIPDYRGTGDPTLVLTDTLSNNTALNVSGGTASDGIDTGDFTLTVGDNKYTNFTVSELTGTDKGFTLTFDQNYLKEHAKDIANKTWTLTYNVDITGYEDDNTYTNTINGKAMIDGTETDIPDVTNDVYTAKLVLNKKDADKTNSDNLKGAEFQLKTTVEGSDKYVKYTDGKFSLSDEAYTFTDTANTGVYTFAGLDPDYTYTIIETKAPQGYSKAADMTLQFKQDSTDKTKYTAVITGDSLTSSQTTTPAATVTANVNDTQLGALPSTGGEGIVLLATGGIALMAVFGGFYIVSLKKRA